MSKTLDLATLQSAVRSSAAFRCRRRLQPAGGPGDKVFPPTFAGAVYAVEQRRVVGEDGKILPEPKTCVVLDTVQSQANRMEQALQEAIDGGRIAIPVLKVDFSAWSPTGSKSADEKFIDDVGTITSLQVPHRLADAILRDSQTQDGTPFRKSEKGKALNTVSQRNATALYQLCPTALIFGMWDSTGPKGGLGAKFERAMVSEVVGVGATVQETHKARGVRRDPLEIRKAVPILRAADKSWSIAEPKTKGVDAPSSINHGSVPFDSDNAGTTIEYAEQVTTLSLIVLRRLCFPTNGAPTSEVDMAGRTVLAALGLCAATLAFESGLALRSRCLIWPEDAMIWELLAKPGDKPETFSLSSDEAIALLQAAVVAAEKAKLEWEEAAIPLFPQPKLAELVRLSQLEATKDEGNDAK
ncbi:MAG: type I-U CRISPR-associated protein Cas7 [Verrucomicrobia bacterium]|nr:type I-U CRISPR-associated protein Cas7 [Verrucomicrobiota bacterium]